MPVTQKPYNIKLFLPRCLPSLAIVKAALAFLHLVILLAHKCFFTGFCLLVWFPEE